MLLARIVSGGETGDRGALDAALAVGYPGGGWCPAVRRAYRRRARQNVIESDGTIILFYESLKGGTRLTRTSDSH